MLLESIGGAYTFWLFMINSILLLIFIWKKIPRKPNSVHSKKLNKAGKDKL